MSIEAMKQALEKIANVNAMDYEYQRWAREAIREHAMYEMQRLGQEIEQEPVAWMYICDGDEAHPVLVHTQKDWTRASWWHEVPLYTTPQQRTWVGLTVDEILSALESVDPETKRLPKGLADFAYAVEAKLKEKNNG